MKFQRGKGLQFLSFLFLLERSIKTKTNLLNSCFESSNYEDVNKKVCLGLIYYLYTKVIFLV
jgi:hypothetical protein